MLNIIINASALRTGGALTIYRQFIQHLPAHVGGNKYYIIVDPSVEQPPIEGVIYVHDNNHSKLHNICWSFWGLNRWLKSKEIIPDVIVSLQNIGTVTNCKQIVYYHQPLPFYQKRWSFMKASERTMALYKYIYPYFVKSTISTNTEVVVQIPFIKKKFVEKFKCNPNRVHVMFPDVEKIDVEKIEAHHFRQDLFHFIYPASNVPYKEHRTLVNAMAILKAKNTTLAERIHIHLTFQKDEYPALCKYIEEKKLCHQFIFDGSMPHERLLAFYKGSDGLLFPSTIETLGLPLLEAATFGLPIIAADLDYAREVIGNYAGVKFVDCHDYDKWAAEIETVCAVPQKFQSVKSKDSSWNDFFALIDE